MTKPKKSGTKKKIHIVEEDSVPKEHRDEAAEMMEKSMYDRHPEMFAEEEQEPVPGTMTYNIAYIRSEPKQKARILKIVYKDAPLSLLSEDEGGWIRVRPLDEPKFEGYIKSAFVQKAEG